MFSQSAPEILKIEPEIIRLFDTGTQNYSLTYPTTDHFKKAFDSAAYITNASNRKIGGIYRPLSIYVHIPFCHSNCFCSNHSHIVAKSKHDYDTQKYTSFLLREIKLQGQLFKNDACIEKIYIGGGTPTLLNNDQLLTIANEISRHFHLSTNGKYNIEIHPSHITSQTMATLKKIGFNEVIILAAQDTDDKMQQALHCQQNENTTLAAIQSAKKVKFQSINTRIIYGLPKQTVQKFKQTLKKIILERPDQISLVSYVYFPQKIEQLRKIKPADLPSAEIRLKITQQAFNQLTDAGYIHIGANHFVDDNHELAIAQQQGRLYYNFQNYSTHADSDLIGLGVAAIGSIGPTYSQNEQNLSHYYDKLIHNFLPITRGLELTADDLLRRLVMHTLICNTTLLFESIETVFPITFKDYFEKELFSLIEYEKIGLLTVNDEGIVITPKGKILIHNICIVFDKYLCSSDERRHLSRMI